MMCSCGSVRENMTKIQCYKSHIPEAEKKCGTAEVHNHQPKSVSLTGPCNRMSGCVCTRLTNRGNCKAKEP